jgi:hypothetical protein
VSLLPDPVDRARDVLARRAEAEYPGWRIRHGLYGWDGTRARDQRAERAGSLPALTALIDVADSAPDPRPATAPPCSHAPASPQVPGLSWHRDSGAS